MALAQEFRFAARMLAKNKGWTAVAAAALALGLGANVAIFSVVRVMLWTPLPYPAPEQLANLAQSNAQKGFTQASVSYRDTRDWLGGSTIASIAAFQQKPMAVNAGDEPQYVPAMQVTPEFFPTLGVNAAVGRTFLPVENPASDSRAAVISHEMWQGLFRGEPSVLGREIRLEGRTYNVVGVMPEGFHFLYQRADVWVPLQLDANQREQRGWRGLNTVARLRPGTTFRQAQQEVLAISERLEKEDPKAGQGWRGKVQPLADRMMGKGAKAAAGSMFGAVGLVLLIACANVASLLLARGTYRRREMALRASLGATRGSLIRLQLAESLLLSAIGGAAGVISAIWSIPLLKMVAPKDMELAFRSVGLDWQVFGFGLALSLVTSVLFGLIPALLLTHGDLAVSLQDASRGSSGGRNWVLKGLVVGEMALALVLVAASTFLIRHSIRQAAMDPGFDKTHLVAGHVLLSTARYPGQEQVIDFYSQVLDRLRSDGSLESAALVQTMPLGGNNSYSRVRLEGEEGNGSTEDRLAGEMVVSPGYFQAMKIPLLHGRDFSTADNVKAPGAAIVSETFARRYWPKDELPRAIGRRIRVGSGEKAPWLTVVGVARDVRHTNLTDPPRPELYQAHSQNGARIMMLLARGKAAQSAASALRSAVRLVDRDQPVFRLESVDAMLANRRAGERATTQVLGFLAGVALLLAAVGTYGVMAYTAAQRMREIGIRLALGATPRLVFAMVLKSGLALALLGLGVGIPAAYGVTPVLEAIVGKLETPGVGTYAAVAGLLLTVGVVSCLIPAWRSMRLDPSTVLRNE